ncbi:MAG: tRNA preQ1(34) S-adenosylmethionine ribosyltransferase-isomerase QueA, partial [Candidatus Neomarinimicrobiota bacterium]
YDLPEELIAQYPLKDRDHSRLLVLNRKTGHIDHMTFDYLPDLLHPGDLLVFNETKVISARLKGKKASGGKAEIFLLNQKDESHWECLVKPGRRIRPGTVVHFSDTFKAEIIDVLEEGGRLVRFTWEGDFWDVLEKYGQIPLPPYVHREPEPSDKENYQTVYARKYGSVAAHTAGLHFTRDILDRLSQKGVESVYVNLRVGLGTFRPVKTERIDQHTMHREFCEISTDTANAVNKALNEGRRVIAVGTTSTRTLESFAVNGKVHSGGHFTDIFIYPGGRPIQIISGLITNFHMPKSTLLMLVSAFAGYENIMNAYQIAVQEKYRFFSYGDAMAIF